MRGHRSLMVIRCRRPDLIHYYLMKDGFIHGLSLMTYGAERLSHLALSLEIGLGHLKAHIGPDRVFALVMFLDLPGMLLLLIPIKLFLNIWV